MIYSIKGCAHCKFFETFSLEFLQFAQKQIYYHYGKETKHSPQTVKDKCVWFDYDKQECGNKTPERELLRESELFD